RPLPSPGSWTGRACAGSSRYSRTRAPRSRRSERDAPLDRLRVPAVPDRVSDPRDREIADLRATLEGERRRLERELDFARRIQLNLMPAAPPQPPGWEIATAYRAARVVGGDFYDAFDLPGRDGTGPLVGLVIADVTGKGLTAALMMAFTRAVHRAAAYNGTGPSDALERTNRVLVRDARTGLFVTAIGATLDPAYGRFRYASAGHEPPLLLRAGASGVEELPAGGMLL